MLSITSIGDMQEPKAESATLVEEEGWLLAEDSPPLVMASSDLELSQNVARYRDLECPQSSEVTPHLVFATSDSHQKIKKII